MSSGNTKLTWNWYSLGTIFTLRIRGVCGQEMTIFPCFMYWKHPYIGRSKTPLRNTKMVPYRNLSQKQFGIKLDPVESICTLMLPHFIKLTKFRFSPDKNLSKGTFVHCFACVQRVDGISKETRSIPGPSSPFVHLYVCLGVCLSVRSGPSSSS